VGEPIAGDGAEHRRRDGLKFAEQSEDCGHAADSVRQLGEHFGDGAGAESVQVFHAALEAEAVKRLKVNHS
jgi:hypothetical protein